MIRIATIPAGPRRGWNVSKVSLVALVATLGLGAGCSQPGPFLRRQTMMGALKTNVAQLESEKDQLAKELAEQRAETRRVETQLAEAEDRNSDISARLDDARAVIARQGLDDSKSLAPSRSASESDRLPPRRSTPARSQPKGRRTPFAQIPNERRALDDPDDRSLERDSDPSPPRRVRDDSDDQGRLDDRSPWLPVARGGGFQPTRVR